MCVHDLMVMTCQTHRLYPQPLSQTFGHDLVKAEEFVFNLGVSKNACT